MKINYNATIKKVIVKDLRFPTSLKSDGADAMHTDPDYSCAYVQVLLDNGRSGYGLTFTLGRGTEIVVKSIEAMEYLIVGQKLDDILLNFGGFWRKLTSESQLRWVGPEKGVTHLAVAAIINAIWDLWAKLENVPVWKLLVDMEPEFLVSLIDFRYITDVVTKEEAIQMLKYNKSTQQVRIQELQKVGYPCYTTQVGWINYDDTKVKRLCKEYLDQGFTAFKVKVGQDLSRDIHRCKLIREEIGFENKLMVDANQIWEVEEAIEWMKKLAEFKPHWIEEPTSPDDVLGHATIAKALKPYGIGVATGEMCCNRVLFKQFLQANALEFLQIDSARIGGVNEILAVYLMAKKFGVKVVPHAGGIGLCEMVQHMQYWDFVSLSASKEGKWIEYVDQQHEHFLTPVVIKNAHYIPPTAPGYSTEIFEETIRKYEYPMGSEWQRMFKEKVYNAPTLH